MHSTPTPTLPAPGPDLQPTQAQERIPALDLLRGFALLGILLVNMPLFNAPFQLSVLPPDPGMGAPDRLALWFIRLFGEGKFYSLFATLFGLGLYLQMTRLESRGARFGPLYVRRLLVLLAVGLVHAIFFWVGDILILYALLGSVLLLFAKSRPRTLLIWIGVLLSLILLFNAAMTGLVELARTIPESATEIAKAFAENEAQLRRAAEQAVRAYQQGSLAEIQAQRWSDLGFILSITPFYAPNVLVMFLWGLYLGRRGLALNLVSQTALLRRVFWWGLAVGLPGNLLYVVAGEFSKRIEPSWLSFLSTAGQTLGAPALAMCYASGLLLLFQRPTWQRRLAPLTLLGRAALSNYLLQTLVCTTLFYGYGLKLFGRVGPAAGIVLTLLIYLVQLWLTGWWFRRFRYGPLEWFWRSLTYGRWQPLRA